MTSTQASPPPAAKANAGYIVLSKGLPGLTDVTGGEHWQRVGTSHAKTADAAIKEVVGKTGDEAGMFVAVPARSWRPVKVSAKTETRLIVEDA